MTSSSRTFQVLVLTAATLTFTLILTLLPISAHAAAGISFDGRILKPDSSPVSGQFTQFKMQIRTPDAANCLMYEETQTLNLQTSQGFFDLTLGDGSGSRTDTSGYPLDRIFSNQGSFTLTPASCASGGGIYTPSTTDIRNLVVQFKDETMASFEVLPVQKLNPVPTALDAKQISGFGVDSLMRVVDGSGNPTAASPLSNANYSALLALANGTSTVYEKAGKIGGVTLPTMTSGQVLGWNGSAWTSSDPLIGVQSFAKTALPSCAAGEYLRTSSGNLVCGTPAGGGGGLTAITAGAGLMGGTITTVGTIDLAAIGAGGSGTKIVYDVYGRVTSAVAQTETDIPTLATPGKVIGTAITAGTIGGSTMINTTGSLYTSSNVMAAAVKADAFMFNNAGSMVTLQNPVGSNYALTLPQNMGSNGQVMMTNGSGILSWATPMASPWTTNGSNISYMTGNVGIGTTTPTALLDVMGPMNANSLKANLSGTAASPAIQLESGMGLYAQSAGVLNISTSGVPVATMSTSGFTATRNESMIYTPTSGSLAFPNAAKTFSVVNTALIDGSASLMTFRGSPAGGYYSNAYMGAVTNPGVNTPTFVIGTQSGTNAYSEKLRIDPIGNVGIGTTSPVGALHVASESTATALIVENMNTSLAVPTLSLRKSRGNSSSRMPVITNDPLGALTFSGWDGVSNNASGAIHFRAAENFTTGSQATFMTIGTADTGQTFATERLRVAPNGFVGIGTSAPTVTLDVAGQIRMAKLSSAPSCSAGNDGAMALTSQYTTCVCKSGTGWVRTTDGTTACSW